MADPLDGVVDDVLNPQPPADPAPALADGQVAISQEELDRLRSAASQLEEVAPVLNQLRNNPQLLDEARYRQVTAEPPKPTPTNGFNWEDPEGSTKRIAREAMAQEASMFAEKLANMAIQNFIASKSTDPYFHVVKPLFEKEIHGMNKAQIGALPDQSLQLILTKCWNSNVGEWSSKRAAEKAKAPVNLGGGGAAAGGSDSPKDKKHLRDIDSDAYIMAVQAGMSEEEMAEIAAELQ